MYERGKKKSEPTQFFENGYDRLRLAICEQAVADYKVALRGKRKSLPKYCSQAELERFFRSQWYKFLMDIDGELVIFQVGKSVAEELYVEKIAEEVKVLTFQDWVRGCELNKTILMRLEGEGDTALYKTQGEYEYKHNMYKTSPIYHVWIKGEWVLTTQNYEAAVDTYYKRLKVISNDDNTGELGEEKAI